MKRLGQIVLVTLGLGFCIVVAVISAPFVDFMLVANAGSSLAYALAPPQYPGSELIESWQSGGSGSMWDRRTYRTTDNTDKVLAFMEQHMPGFVTEKDIDRGVVYRNFVQDTSDLAKRAADYACSSLFCSQFNAKVYPSVSITFYADPKNATGTLIHVWIDWPAP